MALKSLTEVSIQTERGSLSKITALLLILSDSDIVAGSAVVSLCYRLTYEIAYGFEPDLRTASICASWYGRLFKAAEMLTRRYSADIDNLLSETRFRIVNGVFSIDVLSIIVQGDKDAVSSSSLRSIKFG